MIAQTTAARPAAVLQPCRARVGGVWREEQRPETRGRAVGVLKWADMQDARGEGSQTL